LPFLGTTKAEAIIKSRNDGIIFKTAEDLDIVKGIGPKTIENIKPYLEFGTE
jgi:competence protein ComEA